MKQMYSSLRDLICPQMTANASKIVDEPEERVTAASESIIASLLGVMLKKGDTPQIRNTFDEAGNLDIFADSKNICREKPTEAQRKLGDDFLQLLLGDKAADFTDPIAKNAGISKVATNRMVAMIAPLVAGYFGNQMVKEGNSLPVLLNNLREQRSTFVGLIPAGVVSAFGLQSVLSGVIPETNRRPVEEPKKKNNWVMWIILIIVLLLLLLWWRSCNNRNDAVVADRNNVTMMDNDNRQNTRSTGVATPPGTPTATTGTTGSGVSAGTATATGAGTAAGAAGGAAPTSSTGVATTPATQRATRTISLPNNQNIQAYEGGVEQEMVNFLQSNEYRNATDEDLRNRWFQFDNIAFEYNSTTQLMEQSRAQLNNIITILRNYPNARIKIAGFADNRGTSEVNMEVSNERAKSIEKMLDDAGVGSQVVRTQGYGDEYATRSPNAPDSERAKDRDIALRFVK